MLWGACRPGILGRGDGLWFAVVLGAGRGWGFGCSPVVGFLPCVCLGSGPGICFRHPCGLLIIVALWFEEIRSHFKFILWLIMIGGGGGGLPP